MKAGDRILITRNFLFNGKIIMKPGDIRSIDTIIEYVDERPTRISVKPMATSSLLVGLRTNQFIDIESLSPDVVRTLREKVRAGDFK